MQDKIVTLAKELIAIPSVTTDIEKAVEVLEVAKKHLPNYPFTAFVDNHYPSLLFSNRENTKEFKIILNSHLDVVPAPHEKFIPVIKDGKLYGKGAYDMKAAAAVHILLFNELGAKLSYPLGLQLVTEEETWGIHGTGHQIERGIRGEFVIIGECNSNFTIGNKSKGRKVVRLTVKGIATHSAYAWQGENALWRMYEVLDPIRKAFPHPKEETFETTVNLTQIELDTPATNKIPGSCVAYIDIRYAPNDEKTIINKIRALLPNDVLCEVDDMRPHKDVATDNVYIQKLQELTKDVRGTDVPLRFAHGTSDATFYAEVGCDAIEFGPVGEGAHHDDEWVDIQSLEDYYQILKQFLLTVDKEVA